MPSDVHCFAAFELNPSRRALYLQGREVPLQPRVFDLLRYLVEHRDRVVSKEELLDALWPGMVVTESSLQRAVSLARIQIESLDLAVAQGCLRRAERLLGGLPKGEQHGNLAWMTARYHLNKGEFSRAIQLAQEARDIVEAARIRLRLAGLLARQGDHGAARMELSAAESVFQSAGARGYLDRCLALRDGLEP